MNNVNLIGRLARDPQCTQYQTQNGMSTSARFTVAVDRGGQDACADFISCVAFGKTAEFIQKYFHQGQRIGCSGNIRTGSYQNNQGATIYTTDVNVTRAEFCDAPQQAQQPNATTPQYNMQQGQQYYQQMPVQQPVQQQPVQQPVQQPAPKAKGKAKQQPVPVAQAQPQNAYVPQQEQFVDYNQMPQVDEGLPFN